MVANAITGEVGKVQPLTGKGVGSRWLFSPTALAEVSVVLRYQFVVTEELCISGRPHVFKAAIHQAGPEIRKDAPDAVLEPYFGMPVQAGLCSCDIRAAPYRVVVRKRLKDQAAVT